MSAAPRIGDLSWQRQEDGSFRARPTRKMGHVWVAHHAALKTVGFSTLVLHRFPHDFRYVFQPGVAPDEDVQRVVGIATAKPPRRKRGS